MPKMTATKEFPYGFDQRKIGDSFEVADHDVAALEITGLAKLAKAKGVQYQTKVMTAESEAKHDPKPAKQAVVHAPESAAMTTDAPIAQTK